MPVIFSGREGWLSGFVVGTSGELLFRGEPKAGRVLKGLWGNKRGVVASRLGKRAIRAFNMASEASLTPKKLQTKDPMVDLEGAVLRQFMGSRGTVGRYYWGKEEFKIFFDLVVDPSGKACGSILLFQESQILQGAFVKMVERRYRRFAQRNGEPPFRLLAFPKMGRIAFSEPLRRNGLAAEILRMQDSLNKMGNLNSRIVSLFGVSGKSRAESLSITGLPGAELETLNLYFFLGMGAIETASRALLSRLACFAAFVIGFALLLGSIFSVTLLKPFGILVKGLKSLVAGRYAETISIESGDEFQGIGDGLNHILGEMKDLALAQTIHDRLFPASAFRSADSACHGWILESTGTEGHFFDHIETGAGQLAFWVGRLPEQGVSDALLIGSLKMAIRVSLGLGEKDVSRISEEVHRKFLTPSSRSSFDSAFSSPSSPASCSAPNFAIDYASGFAPASETAFESRSKSAFEVASENFGLFLGILDRKTGRLDFSLRGDLTVWNADAPNIKHDGSFQTILLKSGERFAVTTFGKNVIQGFDAQTFQERFEKLLRAESGVVLEHFGNETARLLRNFPMQGKVPTSHVILVADFRGRGL